MSDLDKRLANVGFEADKILSGIRHWVQKGGDESHLAYLGFPPNSR